MDIFDYCECEAAEHLDVLPRVGSVDMAPFPLLVDPLASGISTSGNRENAIPALCGLLAGAPLHRPGEAVE